MNYQAAKDFITTKLEMELASELTYHGLHHTLDVLVVTEQLCEKLGVGEYETTLLKTAALYHDSGFTESRTEHEQLGCKIAKENLPKFGYTTAEINLICGMIMATKIPQSPKNFLEEIICDADLDYLGRDDFHSIGASLFQELKNYKVLDSEEKWNRIQVGFIGNHSYFTTVCEKDREPRKQLYLGELERLVATY